MPDPYLNLVIGPNGSGKSSLMCALCLVFAGSLKALGRQNRFNEFIKWGKSQAEVEVEIYDDSKARNPVIKCVIQQRGAVLYFVDNEESTNAQVQAFAQGYNIQVDNLCQFLAQDNVVQFSRQSPLGLLRNTTEAVGSVSLKKRWKEANDCYELNVKRMNNLESLEKRKRELEEKISQLRPVAERCRKTHESQQEVALLQQKLAFLIFQDNLQSLKAEADALKQAKSQFADEFKSEKKFKNEVAVMEQKKKDIENEIATKKELLSSKMKLLRVCRNSLLKSNEAVVGAFERRLTLEAQIVKIKQSIKEQSEAVLHLQVQLKDRERPREELQNRLHAVKQQLRSEQQKANEVFNSIEEIELQINSVTNTIQSLEKETKRQKDLTDERIQLLTRLDQSCMTAYRLMEAHRGKFKRNAWLPLLSISISSSSDVIFVENAIPLRDLLTFLFEDFDDMELFLGLTKSNNLKINCGLVPANSKLVALNLDEGLKSHGFANVISNMFDAPTGVKSYLCTLHNLGRICVGTSKTEKDLSAVVSFMSARGLSIFFTPRFKMIATKSHYSGKLTTLQKGLQNARIFHSRTNASVFERAGRQLEEKRNQLIQLTNERKQLQQRVDKFKKSIEPYKTQMNELNTMLDKINTFRDHVRIEEESFKKQKCALPKLQESLRSLVNEIGPCLQHKLHLLENIADTLKEARELAENVVKPSMSYNVQLASLVDAKDRLSKFQASLVSKKEYLFSLESAHSARSSEMVTMKTDLLQVLGIDSANCSIKNLFAPIDLAQELRPLPSDSEEINSRITKLQYILSGHSSDDERILKAYTKCCDDVERIAVSYDHLRDQVATSTGDLLTAKKQWISEAKKLTDSISKRFGLLMRQLGYDGEVRLDVPSDDQAPIDRCGLRIMVQFGSRDALRELDDHHQSGGERSVSIILYMFALQQLSAVPFRCVDEINQGMDPVNERKVFDLMVKMLSGSSYDSRLGGTQYIMFTPKLLPNCNFGQETKLWCLLNGVGAPTQKMLTNALKAALENASDDQLDTE